MYYNDTGKKIKLGDIVSSTANNFHLWKIVSIIEKIEDNKIVKIYELLVISTKTNDVFVDNYDGSKYIIDENSLGVLVLERRRNKDKYGIDFMVYSKMKNAKPKKVKIKDKITTEDGNDGFVVGIKRTISRDDNHLTLEYRIFNKEKEIFTTISYKNPKNMIVANFNRR